MKAPRPRSTVAVRIAVGVLGAVLARGAIAEGPASSSSAVPLEALILTGGSEHDWRSRSATLRRILSDSGRFDVRVCESPVGLTARTLASPPPGDATGSARRSRQPSGPTRSARRRSSSRVIA